MLERRNITKRVKTKKPLRLRSGFFVGLLGLEPRTTEPKSAVLPLHHRPLPVQLRVQMYVIFLFFQNFMSVFSN